MIDTLSVLRAVTIRLRRVPGALFGLEPLRRRYCNDRSTRVVSDFDGNLFQVRLDEHMGSHIFWYGSYSREILLVLDRILRPGMVVIDVGANIGEVAIYSAKRVVPWGRVICFEPMAGLAMILRENVARNGALPVTILECGVADRVGSAQVFTPSERFRDGGEHAGLATLYGQEGRRVAAGTIPLTTLDHHFGDAEGSVNVIKVDVEGAELAVLQGATKVLKRWHPWLILEVQRETSAAAGYEQREILDYLDRFGYSFARIGRRGRLTPVTSSTLGDFQNVLAAPPDRSMPTA